MSKLLRRPTRGAICFFCQSEVHPRDPRAFKCSQCSCWNRYDSQGEIISDEPAMHDETMNAGSFAKRASPRKDRIPTTYSPGQFCHACQTNQTLVSNLLSNYLPPPDDPEYARMSELLPEYRASLEARYPQICPSCLPSVEEEIKRRDNMARSSALAGFLKTSRGKGKERQSSTTQLQQQRSALEREQFFWRIRGAFWGLALLCSVGCYVAVLRGHALQPHPWVLTALPFAVFLSLFWAVWDPRYMVFRRSQIQGREVRLRSRREYIVLQILAWLSRLVSALLLVVAFYRPTWDVLRLRILEVDAPSISPQALWYTRIVLGLEICILLRSAMILRVDRPPPVHLMGQFSHRPTLAPTISPTSSQPTSRNTTPAADADMLATLSLSNMPVFPQGRPTSPVFGMPSLQSAANIQDGYANEHVMEDDVTPEETDQAMDDDDEAERDPDAMDWSPIRPARPTSRPDLSRLANSDIFMRPQRFFAPEEPTGLESLFATTVNLSDEDMLRREEQRKRGGWVGWVKDRWK